MTTLQHTRRLYLDTGLSAGQSVEPCDEHAHYLIHVLRLKVGEQVRLFNGHDGEWLAKVAAVAKRTLTLSIEKQLKPQSVALDLWLCAAPIKKAHFDFMIEKATELGASVLQPILTTRAQIREVNVERCRILTIEAAQQSERLSLPEVNEPITPEKMLASWPTDRTLIVCAEWGEAEPIGTALPKIINTKAAILTGPEGGFAAEELEALRRVPQAVFVRLGPRILRADTAAIAALTCWQALRGDWH
jgi:16S rRNA (uracil1498-N3)-methyltransferase